MGRETISDYSSLGLAKRRIVIKLTPAMSSGSESEVVWIGREDDLANIEVSITRGFGSIDPHASIRVCNLSPSIIRQFTTPYYAPNNPARIDIWAGYQTDRSSIIDMIAGDSEQPDSQTSYGNNSKNRTLLRKIFSGVILWALPQSGRPDVWFAIDAGERFFEYQKKINHQYTNMTPCEIISELARESSIPVNRDYIDDYIYAYKSSGLPLSKMTQYDHTIPFYEAKGTFGEFIDGVRRWCNMTASLTNGTIYLYPSSQDINFTMKSLVDPSRILRIAADSNITMIGEPSPNPTGVNVRILLTYDILPMDIFILDSKIFQPFSATIESDENGNKIIKGSMGTYWVQKINYKLTTRGNDFYCDLVCRRVYR